MLETIPSPLCWQYVTGGKKTKKNHEKEPNLRTNLESEKMHEELFIKNYPVFIVLYIVQTTDLE